MHSVVHSLHADHGDHSRVTENDQFHTTILYIIYYSCTFERITITNNVHSFLWHGTTQSAVRTTSLPAHAAPPFIGNGLSHVRDRIRPRGAIDWWSPPSHRHSVHALQALQPPSAEKAGMVYFFGCCSPQQYVVHTTPTVNCQRHRCRCLIAGNVLRHACVVAGILRGADEKVFSFHIDFD